MAIKVKFKKSINSPHWKYLEDRFPGAKDVMQDVMLNLTMTGYEDAYLAKNISRGIKKYTIIHAGYKVLLTIYLHVDKKPVVRLNSYESFEVDDTQELKNVLNNWVINL